MTSVDQSATDKNKIEPTNLLIKEIREPVQVVSTVYKILFTLCHTQHLSKFGANLGNIKSDYRLIYFHCSTLKKVN